MQTNPEQLINLELLPSQHDSSTWVYLLPTSSEFFTHIFDSDSHVGVALRHCVTSFVITLIMEASVPIVTLAVLLGVLGLSFPLTPELLTSLQYYSAVAVGNGSTLCATDISSSLESATNRLRCGQLCVLQPFCYHFNYFTKKKHCAMFYTPPQSFSILDGCRSYKTQVRID